MTSDLLTTLAAADPVRTDTYDDDALAVLARRVLTERAEPGVARHVGRRPVRWRLTIALPIAAMLAVGLAVAPTLLGGHAGVSAEAATLLDRAADAIGASDPPARPDQYWRIDTTETALDESFTSTSYSAVLVRRTTTDYLAVDGSRPTYRVDHGGQVVTRIAGSGPDTAPGGPQTSTTDTVPNNVAPSWQQPTPAFLKDLPRDTAALEARLRADSEGAGRSPDGEVFVVVVDVLRTGLVPADLRQALYRVLADVPGVRVVDRTATIGSDTGVAFARDETSDGSRQEIIVDPATGAFVGEREVLVTGTSDLPAGTVTDEVTTQRTLVDAVPTDVIAAAG